MQISLNFPAPTALHELMGLVNAQQKSRLTLVTRDGRVFGYYADHYGMEYLANDGKVHVLDGTQDESRIVFEADSDETALAFLFGCFYGIYHGRPLEDIQEEAGTGIAGEYL